MKQQT